MRINLIILLCSLLIASCDIFQTRTPEQPNESGQVLFIQPDRPEIVIQNLINSLEGTSLQNYLACFSSTEFTFNPTNVSIADNPGIFGNWGIQEEQNYINNLFAEAQLLQGHRLIFNNERYEIQSETRQQFIAEYTLTMIHNRSSSGVPTTTTGELIFLILADDTGLWSIHSWSDIETSTSFSWSDLKAVFIRN